MVDLSTVIQTGSKRYGSKTFLRAGEQRRDFPRVPTGIFPLDFAIGGGFPVGVTSSVYGPPGGGKTTITSRLVWGGQNICWECFKYTWDCECDGGPYLQDAVIIATEINDMTWAELLGVDADRVTVVEPDTGEQAVDILISCLRADDCGIVILDSLAMLTPAIEIMSSSEELQVGAQAKLISKMMRRVKAVLIAERKRDHNVLFAATNQVRAKIGGFNAQRQEEIPGGFVSKHDWHLMFRSGQLTPKKRDENDNPLESKFAVSTRAMGSKKKLITLAASAEFTIATSDDADYPIGTITDQKATIAYAQSAGLLTKDPWTLMGEQYDKKADIIAALERDEELMFTLKREIINEYIRRRAES